MSNPMTAFGSCESCACLRCTRRAGRAAEEAAFILQAAVDAGQRDRAPRPATFAAEHRVPLLLALDALEDQRRLTPDLNEFRETLRKS